MKACFLNDKECRCTLQILRELGVLYWFIPLDSSSTATELVDQIKSDRRYLSDSECEVSDAKNGSAATDEWIKLSYREHSHGSEEARLILDGECFLDVRDSADYWIRIHLVS